MKSGHFFVAVIASLFCVLLTDCAPYSNKTARHDAIYGIWIWERSSGGFTGRQVITAETVGYIKKILFTPQGVFQEFRDDSLWVATSYTIVRKKTIFGSDHDVICFHDSSGLMEQVIMQVNDNRLELSDPCYDCFGHLYIRVRE
jgi:hypothetical protein